MKLTKSLVVLSLACGTLWAQAPANQNNTKTPPKPAPAAATQPAAKPAAPASKPAATTATKPAPAATKAAPAAAKATTPAPTPKPAAKAQVPVVKPAPAPKPVAKAPVAPIPTKAAPVAAKKPSAPAAAPTPASAKEEASASRVSATGGKLRDPFVSPVIRTPTGAIGAGCDTGKRCLVVDQIVLKGIVKSASGFIAVVENPAKRAYFMRENDPVFNGKVIKITGDTVVFQESVMDKLGKQSQREVVKKVNAPIV